MRRRRTGFTLMEFIVVLGVIGILIGLLFPALMIARERARVTRARGEVMALQQAWQAYWMTYGDFPWYGSRAMDAEAVAVLGGEDATGNRHQIAFMEFDRKHYAEGFLDPWRRHYRIELTREPLAVDTTWEYQTRVNCGNSARNRY